MTAPLPTLGLAVRAGSTDGLVPLLGALRRWCEPLTLGHEGAPPVAVLATSLRAPVPAALPLAVVVRTVAELDEPLVADARVVVSDDPAVVAAARARHRTAVLAPPPAPDMQGQLIPPFVRERLRRLRGLPADAVLRGGHGRWFWHGSPEPLADDLVATALGCAAVVIATGRDLLGALLWGAPCVTDPATAAELGLTDGGEVLVAASDTDRDALAADLLGDPRRAAALSRAGRSAARDLLDVDTAAARLVVALGLAAGGPRGGLRVVDAHLTALDTPPRAHVRARAARAIAALPAVGERTADSARSDVAVEGPR
ncbi:MAG: hypothetical protein JWM67_2817 [Mycobacterium sp.]|nr:hypothetical protein [Mycobacterium sp.]